MLTLLLWRAAAILTGILALLSLFTFTSLPDAGRADSKIALLAVLVLCVPVAALAWRGGDRARAVSAPRYLLACGCLLLGALALAAVCTFVYFRLIRLAVSTGNLLEILLLVAVCIWLVGLGLRGTGCTPRGYDYALAFRPGDGDAAAERRSRWRLGVGLWITGAAGGLGLVPLMLGVSILWDGSDPAAFLIRALAVGLSGSPAIVFLSGTLGLDPLVSMRVAAAGLVATPFLGAAGSALVVRLVVLRGAPAGAAPSTGTPGAAILVPAAAALAAFACSPAMPISGPELWLTLAAAAAAAALYGFAVMRIAGPRTAPR